MLGTFVRNYLIFSAILLVCLGCLAFILISGDRQIDRTDSWIFHGHEIIIQSEEMNSLISGMLASQRGYLITGKKEFFDEYNKKKADVSQHIAHLRDLTMDNPSQQSRLEELGRYFINFSEQLENRAALLSNETPQQILDDVTTVNRLKENIERLNDDFLEEEYGLLNRRTQAVEMRKDQYLLTLLVGGGVAFVLLMILNGYLLRVQSKRSAAEHALGESEEVFRLAVEATQDGVYDWNLKTGKIFYSSQFAFMLGYEPEDLPQTIEDFYAQLHENEKERVEEHLNLYLEGHLSEYSDTFQMRHKSGRWIWIHSRGKMIRDKNGRPARMVGAQTDVSASKEYELRLHEAKTKAEEANRAKSDFLAHMSHEIRTPLTTISGAAEILEQNRAELDEKKQSLIRALNTSAITLKDLISDVLDFSKIESGEMELEESVFDLQEIFEHVISIMAAKAGEKNLDFAFDYEDVKNLRLYNDPVRLRQILINLVGNAVKFTDKGHVHIKAYQDVKNDVPVLRVDVEDTGIGIHEDFRDLVFERFKQADNSVSRKYGGTGLGLPISKRLAHLMGGDIELKSAHGQGSTFSLVLPLRVADESLEDQKNNTARKHKINDKLKAAMSNVNKILLVEDYEGNIVVLSYILEDMECEFDVARTGLEALNLWKENHYDLILMDVQMPEMDGFTATAHIRQMEQEQNLDRTPVIGMTAHALVGDKDKCIEAGMDAYLPKPIVEMDLKSAILKFLKQDKKAA